MSLGTGAASALTLYRYVDADGRVVVVDRMDKIPVDMRGSVRTDDIGKAQPSKNAVKPGISGRLETSAADDFDSQVTRDIPAQSFSESEVIVTGAGGASLTEKIDPAHASATLWLSEMQGIQHRNEEIWYVANSLSPYHKRILVLQEENLRMLDSLRQLDGMSWKDHQDWTDRARGVTDQLRQLAFSISMWLRRNPGRLQQELPPLINRIRMVLDMTASALPPASSGK